MGFFELFLIGIGLSMDAFAVAICKGLGMERINKRDTLLLALFFGGFQALMPLIGYLLGIRFQTLISAFDHWIAFILLALIGVNMIRESRSDDEDAPMDAAFGPRAMLPLAVATSIDALAIGVTFAFLDVSIVPAVILIGCISLFFAALIYLFTQISRDEMGVYSTLIANILLFSIILLFILYITFYIIRARRKRQKRRQMMRSKYARMEQYERQQHRDDDPRR